MTWNNVDMVRQEIRLRTTKTSRRTILPIAKPLLEYLMELPGSDDPRQPLFPRAFQIMAASKHSGTLSNQFHRVLAAAGLVRERSHQSAGKGRDVRRQTSEISFHSLRHTATSLLKGAGISDAVAQEFIGHQSSAISRHYTHIEISALREAAERLPNLLSRKGSRT
jgi:integrase